jgi:hypothetical protein
VSDRQKADAKLQSLLNASGFVFQLGLESAVRGAKLQYDWRVAGREHPWATQDASGYIDLVLSYGNIHLLLECKRYRDAEWLFLMPDANQLTRSHARICWTDTVPHRPGLAGWGDIQVYPSSPQAEFCAIRGQGEKDSPLLERLASQVCSATDGLASDYLQLHEQSRSSNIVIPVIVTTAELLIGRFDPKDVHLATGEIDKVSFSKVPHLRFRKSLTAGGHAGDYEPERLIDLSADSERTVFIVNSSHFIPWLNEFQISAGTPTSPWVLARERSDAMHG